MVDTRHEAIKLIKLLEEEKKQFGYASAYGMVIGKMLTTFGISMTEYIELKEG